MNKQGPLIILNNICKTYFSGNIKYNALSNINLTINHGEYVSIMGPSGSGKSTLMNILGCLDSPTSGEYLLDNDNVSKLSENNLAYIRNKKIGFVFQAFNLISKLTALENVELPMIYSSVSKKERLSRAYTLLEKVGISSWRNHRPNEVSGGQKQRIAIARALTNNPSIILADEPTGNLDSKSSSEIMNIFDNLSKEGVTIIMVTHEEDIAAYSNRTITFKDGRIISDKER